MFGMYQMSRRISSLCRQRPIWVFTYRLDIQKCEHVKNCEVIVTGERHHDLYNLHILPIQPETPAEVLLVPKVETLQLWHERPRHQNKR